MSTLGEFDPVLLSRYVAKLGLLSQEYRDMIAAMPIGEQRQQRKWEMQAQRQFNLRGQFVGPAQIPTEEYTMFRLWLDRKVERAAENGR